MTFGLFESICPFDIAFITAGSISESDLTVCPIAAPFILLCLSIIFDSVPLYSIMFVTRSTADFPIVWETRALAKVCLYASRGPFLPPSRLLVPTLYKVYPIMAIGYIDIIKAMTKHRFIGLLQFMINFRTIFFNSHGDSFLSAVCCLPNGPAARKVFLRAPTGHADGGPFELGGNSSWTLLNSGL